MKRTLLTMVSYRRTLLSLLGLAFLFCISFVALSYRDSKQWFQAKHPVNIRGTLKAKETTRQVSIPGEIEKDYPIKPVEYEADKASTGACYKRLRIVSPHPHNYFQVNYWAHHLAGYLGIARENMYFANAPKNVTEFYFADPCLVSVVIVPRGEHRDCQSEDSILKTPFYEIVQNMRTEAAKRKGGLIPPPANRQAKWVNGVYWPKKHSFVRLSENRPLLVYVTGEVFDHHRPKPNMDLVLYTAQESIGGTLTGNFNLGIAYSWKSEVFSRQFSPLSFDPERLVQPPHILGNKTYFERLLDNKSYFAGMVNSRVIKRGWHHIDAVVRFAVCSLLDDYKGCANLGGTPPDDKFLVHPNRHKRTCKGNDLSVIPCLKQFKFVVSMENTIAQGYFTEKLFYAKLAGAVPIYFGASNAEEFLNTDAFVYCNFNQEAVMKLRELAGNKKATNLAKRIDEDPEYEAMIRKEVLMDREVGTKRKFQYATDRELIGFVRLELKDELQKCIDRVKYLDENREEYLKVSMAPLFKNNQYQNTVIDGGVLGKGVAEIIKLTRD